MLGNVLGAGHGKYRVGNGIKVAAHDLQPFVAARFRNHEHDPLHRMRKRAVDLAGLGRKIGELKIEAEQLLNRGGAAPEHRARWKFEGLVARQAETHGCAQLLCLWKIEPPVDPGPDVFPVLGK